MKQESAINLKKLAYNIASMVQQSVSFSFFSLSKHHQLCAEHPRKLLRRTHGAKSGRCDP